VSALKSCDGPRCLLMSGNTPPPAAFSEAKACIFHNLKAPHWRLGCEMAAGKRIPLRCDRPSVFLTHAAFTLLIVSALLERCHTQPSPASDICPPPAYDYLLSTAAVVLRSCSSHSPAAAHIAPCPAASPSGSLVAIASIVACTDALAGADIDASSDSIAQSTTHSETCQGNPAVDASCRLSSCPCPHEDDDECADCAPGRSNQFPCAATRTQVPGRSFCLLLIGYIPAAFLSLQMSSAAGNYNLASDRLVFQLLHATALAQATPPLGPWNLDRLHRWRLPHTSADDVLSDLDLTYRLQLLGQE